MWHGQVHAPVRCTRLWSSLAITSGAEMRYAIASWGVVQLATKRSFESDSAITHPVTVQTRNTLRLKAAITGHVRTRCVYHQLLKSFQAIRQHVRLHMHSAPSFETNCCNYTMCLLQMRSAQSFETNSCNYTFWEISNMIIILWS